MDRNFDPSAALIVHEWGTLLAMAGSDGATLDGMYHEEHALPEFVHSVAKDRRRVPSSRLKGETPVVYFYANKPTRVKLRVTFQGGVWTHWFPQASALAPSSDPFTVNQFRVEKREPPRGDTIGWEGTILPPGASGLPETRPGALWNFARDVPDAWPIRMDGKTLLGAGSGETERFLFYRGLGKEPLPVRFSAERGGRIESKVPLRHLFLIRVENGRRTWRYLPHLEPGRAREGALSGESWETGDVGERLQRSLVEFGLFPDEACAMTNTWRESYLMSEGVRLLFVLPQAWVERAFPMTVIPTPKKLVRAIVGRIELLTPERERRAENAVRQFLSSQPDERARGRAALEAEGRYIEPILRRIRTSATSRAVRGACDALLKAAWVTRLEQDLPSKPTPG